MEMKDTNSDSKKRSSRDIWRTTLLQALWVPVLGALCAAAIQVWEAYLGAAGLIAVGLAGHGQANRIAARVTEKAAEADGLMVYVILGTVTLFISVVIMNFIAERLGPPYSTEKGT